MKKIYAIFIALSLFLSAGTVFAAPHEPGYNIKTTDGTIYFLSSNGQRRPYTSAGAFLSYGHNTPDSVKEPTAEDLALPVGPFVPPQDGKIICSDRGTDKNTCYLITLGKKAAFTSSQVFKDLGFSFANSTSGDVSFMSSDTNIENASLPHRPGVLINNGGTVYLVGNTALIAIPSVDSFKSWGYTFSDVVLANAADKQLPVSGLITAHVWGLLSPLNFYLALSPNPSPPAPAPSPSPNPSQPLYPVDTATTTPKGLVTISADPAAPATQQISMAQKGALLHVFNFKETSSNEAVNLKGLKITANITGGFTIGNGLQNTAYDTLKNFTLVNGSTVVARSTWSSQTPARDGGSGGGSGQTYVLDFFTGSPLNFQIPAGGSLSLSLKADVNDWQGNASADSKWTFLITDTDAALSGQQSLADIMPQITNRATSNITTVVKQPVSFVPVSSFNKNGNYASAPAVDYRTSAQVMGIFNATSPSTSMRLTSVTLQQSGSALPTGTSSPVTYYIFDGLKNLSHFVGTATLSGAGAVSVRLNLNSAAIDQGVIIPNDGSGHLVIKADSTNFSVCGVDCTPTYGYGLSITGWQWTDSLFPGQVFTGPFGTDTAKAAIYQGGNRMY